MTCEERYTPSEGTERRPKAESAVPGEGPQGGPSRPLAEWKKRRRRRRKTHELCQQLALFEIEALAQAFPKDKPWPDRPAPPQEPAPF